MNDKFKNIVIGSFAAIAISLAVWLVLFLKPSLGDGAKTVRVRFVNIDKINVGTRVTLAGRAIGEVKRIIPITDARSQGPERSDTVYFYELTLGIDSSATIYESDVIVTTTAGLLGEKSIAIIPKRLSDNRLNRPVLDQVLYAESSGSVEEAIADFASVAKRVEQVVVTVYDILDRNEETFHQALKGVANVTQSVNETFSEINKTQLIPQLQESAKSFTITSNEMNARLAKLFNDQAIKDLQSSAHHLASVSKSLNQPQRWETILSNTSEMVEGFNELQKALADGDFKATVNNFHQASDNIKSATESAKLVASKVENGEGTLGQLLTKDDFYVQTRLLLTKANTLMNDINHYGLLFHNNRDWKRARENMIAKQYRLEKPKAFRSYIDDEMDEMQTSLARLNTLFDQTKNDEGEINDQVKAEFVALLKRLNLVQQQLLQVQEKWSAYSKHE